jgi:predicted RNA-binding protein YlxR (DUF448 family)
VLALVEPADIDEGLAAARRGLVRLCLATRELKPVAEMIRYVPGPDGRVVPDLARKLPGRGAWVTATRAALERAIRERVFTRAFQGRGTADSHLPELADQIIERSALSALSLANKAGQVITGFTKIEAALGKIEVALLLNASEAAEDGVRKLDAATAAIGTRPGRISVFRGEQLDLALGRANVVHAALLAHPASASFLARCQILDHWRNGGPAGEPVGAGDRVSRD